MENKKFEVGQFWKDNQDDKHLICDIDKAFIYTFCFADKQKYEWNLDGSIAGGANFVLTEPWQELRSGFVWVNVYYNDLEEKIKAVAHETENQAIYCYLRKSALITPIAQLCVPFKEGQSEVLVEETEQIKALIEKTQP